MIKGGHQSQEAKQKISLALKGKRPKNNLTWQGEDHPNWKGGIRVVAGYRFILAPHHPFRGKQGYVAEHRIVIESLIGRWLRPEEVVHHLDFNKQNNTPENLVLCENQIEHMKRFHNKSGIATRFQKGREGKKTGKFINCQVCGTPRWITPALIKDGRGKYCSKECLYRRNHAE